MKKVTDILRESVLKNCNANITDPEKTLESLRQSEWSPEFEKLMRNRLVMGALRYGLLHAEGKPQYDRVQAILDRALMYEKTMNKEFLVDIANLSLLEFEEGDGFFQSTENTVKVKQK